MVEGAALPRQIADRNRIPGLTTGDRQYFRRDCPGKTSLPGQESRFVTEVLKSFAEGSDFNFENVAETGLQSVEGTPKWRTRKM
jgi:hypothetical protein